MYAPASQSNATPPGATKHPSRYVRVPSVTSEFRRGKTSSKCIRRFLTPAQHRLQEVPL